MSMRAVTSTEETTSPKTGVRRAVHPGERRRQHSVLRGGQRDAALKQPFSAAVEIIATTAITLSHPPPKTSDASDRRSALGGGQRRPTWARASQRSRLAASEQSHWRRAVKYGAVGHARPAAAHVVTPVSPGL